jgi:hypothetical protein
MAHHEIQTLADIPGPPVPLQDQPFALEQQRRLRGMFLGCQLVQTPIHVVGDTQIYSHPLMAPIQYQQRALRQTCMTSKSVSSIGETSIIGVPNFDLRGPAATAGSLTYCDIRHKVWISIQHA